MSIEKLFNKKGIYLISLLILMLSIKFAYSQTDYDYEFHGVVVDQDGTRIPDVSIEIYRQYTSPDGMNVLNDYVETVKTDAKGTYNVPIFRGKFELYYEKDGYIKVERTMEFISLFKVDLGKTVLTRALEYQLSSSKRVAFPGENVQIPLTITNIGEKKEILSFGLESPAGWESNIQNDWGAIMETDVNPGTSSTLYVHIDVPMDASGEYNNTLTITGYTVMQRVITIQVQRQDARVMTCMYPVKTVTPGGYVTYVLNLHNPFNDQARVKFDIDGLPEGWSSHFINAESEVVSEVVLGSQQDAEVEVRVDVPKATGAKSCNFTVSASYAGYVESVSLSTLVEETVIDASMKTKYPSQTVRTGGSTTYNILITNPSNADEVAELRGKGLPDGWQVKFLNSDGTEIQSILLGALETDEINVEVIPSLQSKPGLYNFSVSASSPGLTGSLGLHVNLSGTFNASVEVNSIYEQLQVGDEKTIQVKVSNNGYSPLTDVHIDFVSQVGSIAYTCEPVKVTTLNPNDAATFTVTLRAQPGTTPGDYLLNLNTVSREAELHSDQIRVSVSMGQTPLFTSGVVIAASILLIAVIYQRYRRR